MPVRPQAVLESVDEGAVGPHSEDVDGGDQASELPARHVVQRGAKICFLSESIYAGYLYLENDLISSLNDYGKRKKTPKNGYLDSPRPLLP